MAPQETAAQQPAQIQQPVPPGVAAPNSIAPANPAQNSGTLTDSARQAIRLFLQTTWEKDSPDNRNNASREFIAGQSQWLSNSDVLLAYAVNRMQHNQYDEALQIVRLMHDSNPSNIDAGMLRIWLETVIDEYERALVTIQSLRGQLDDPSVSVPVRQSVIARSGRLIGYMQGPARDDVEIITLETVADNFVMGLNPDEVDLFNDRRERVLDQYTRLVQDNERYISAERDKSLQEDQLRSNLLTNENFAMENRAGELNLQIDQLRQQAVQQVEQERSRAAPMESELSVISGQLNRISRDISVLSGELLYIQQQSPNHPSLFLLSNQIQNLRFTRNNLEGSGRAISNQLAAISSRILEVENSFGQRIRQLNRELSEIEKSARKNNKELNKLAEGPTVPRGKQTAINSRAAALTTYYPFPLELYRAELINRFLN